MPVSRLTLRVKLVLTVMPLVLLFMAWNFTVINQHERDIMQAGTLQRATSVATGLATAAADALAANKGYLLQQDVDAVKTIPDVLSIHIVTIDNVVKADTDPNRVDGPITDDFSTAAMKANSVISNWDERGDVLHIADPIMVDTVTGRVRQGTVIVMMNLGSMEAALAESHSFLLSLTIAIMAATVLVMSLIAGWLVRPLRSLVEDARLLAEGNFNKRSTKLRNDETGELADAFNSLAEKIQDMVRQEQEEHKKLERRVSDLLAFSEKVAGGDLEEHAPVGLDDDMGRLVQGFNAMVDDLHQTVEAERTFRRDLETSKQSLEEANEKLKELDKLKSDFLNTVSHELRTPLTSIKAFSEILMENQGEDRAVQTEFLNIINQESDRLTRLINNLLNLSRIEARQMTFESGPVPIETVVSSAVNGTRALMDKKQLKLEVEVSAGLVVMGDQDKLIQVVTNLLSNAIKFTPSNGHLWISAWSADGEMALDIRDSGIGVPPDFLEKIFEKFQQVETGNMREVKGSGLGR
ncbi:MAG TPA: histidine kinase dimerization/phospho-acceptor domain-containing protein, partial [Candidatus Xenobia bacterium]